MNKQRIAVLGATSHIAKGLIYNFLQEGNFELHLYARSVDKAREFIKLIGQDGNDKCIVHEQRDDLLTASYDTVINCVGVGTATKLQGDYSKYFTVTEEYDNLVLDYLRNGHPDTLYVSFSSGAVYGGEFSSPAQEDTTNCVQVNHIEPKDYYGIVRLNAEAKHRSLKDLNIVDLRLFAYFSRFIDLSDGYFITDIVNSILHNTPLATNDSDFMRDFVHSADLFALVLKCIAIKKLNMAVDVLSAAPIKKSEILAYFSQAYGLQYAMEPQVGVVSATGSKYAYYSAYANAERVGFVPQFTSMDAIREEAARLLPKAKI
ncbi:hypothetical protein A2333_01530 [Candidatus Wolfebacteria bacterium RIFOXYB2_FULL_49_7]|uniref:NAD-dependent epimerase/dehydratase domain-containing protein n=1 Tax=Candidatus Wolfebacteria bacterium RIFOXYB1_FULL_54_12 TaxID=1802559 RepID=A0A1F8DZE4_9BACT|nr:MAG: hypothetical protein A2372_02835 [Candidatus Wolfebacteria bacterium RIFOXYB1_FULL_54_12]OGM96039.1 MAG: hypothetical protein A2333_01530 [Candidatus Wolfebacteria bacterium RIFOXYB2_FULL_49_7]